MTIKFNKTEFAGNVPAIWRGECKILPAGFKLSQTLALGTVVLRGTPVNVDVEAHAANICKIAKVLDGTDADALKVEKGHYFVAGDKVTTLGDETGSATPKTISSIDTSNDGYDVFTLSANITGLVSGKGTIVEASGTSNSDLGASKYNANAVVGSDLEINGKGLPVLDVAYEAVVLTPSLNFPIDPAWLNGFTMKLNPNIIFINQ